MEQSENPFKIDGRQKKTYEAKKRAEEIKELESRYKEEMESAEGTEEDTYEESSEENRAIREIIAKIKSKDPEIYDKDRSLFTEIKAERKSTSETKPPKEKEQTYRLKEYYREIAQEKDAKHEKTKKRVEYDTEQKENLAAFIKAANETENEDIFYKKAPTNKEEDEEENKNKEDFLEDYVLKGGWQKETEEIQAEKDFLEEDSEEIEMIEEFEKECRVGAGGKYLTAKKPNQQRKRKELRKKMRNREEEKKKEEEIKRLKNLKKQQFADRLSILRSVSGLSKRQISKIKLEGSYDRRELDRTLESLFGEDYFREKEETRPKVKGSEMEAEEIKEIERLVATGETQNDRSAIKEIRRIISEIHEIGEEYGALKKQGDFEYVSVESVDLGLSAKDILMMDDKMLKRQYSVKKYAPFKREH